MMAADHTWCFTMALGNEGIGALTGHGIVYVSIWDALGRIT